ncbi:sigma 54-interacting transcriptional regulator [Oscillibacter sp.]|uniref:sigma 54-interacting transcriptional regulator n=1 Tax=Oscillibacter sp. TaxID=1945593 RepID=UPI0028A0860D|nr:sigma 54-interacting transcriptional regulator [Oscillibacter sp.]
MYVFLLSSVNYVEDMELCIRGQNQERGLTAKTTFRDIICRDPSSQEPVKTAKRYAKSNGSVLIHGETSTGKELIASSIHKEVMRIGGNRIIPVDVRIIAATNKNLQEMVKKRSFREYLYYRLALLEIKIPPLKKRKQDLIPLFASFLAEMADLEKRVLYWDNDSVLEPILTYNWPGNIRELRNFAERIVLLRESYQLAQPFVAEMNAQFSGPIIDNLKELERNYLLFLLDRFNGNKEKVCSYLHMSKPTLWRKLSAASKEV